MSEAGEIIPAAAADDPQPAAAQQQDDGDAVVVAAAVVDDNDDDEGSTGSVVVAKIVEDEPPPTPNTAKLERDLAQTLPSTVTATNNNNIKKADEKEDITPIKRNLTLDDTLTTTTSSNKDKSEEIPVEMQQLPVKEEMTTSTSEKKSEGATQDSSGPTEKSEVAKEPNATLAKESPSEKKMEANIKSEDEKPPSEVVTTKDSEKVEPMEVEHPPAPAATKNDDDTDAEDGEIVEDGEVKEEGEMVENTLMKPPPAETAKEETKNEVQTKEEEPAQEEMKKDEDVQKEEPSTTVTPPIPAVKKTKSDDEDEDGEIKEDSEEDGQIKEDTEEEGEIKDADTEEEGEVKEEKAKPGAAATKEDVDMEDAMSQSEETGDRDDGMDTASNDGDTASLVDESTTRKVEPTYSTRGRASGSNTPVPRGSESTGKGSAQSGAKTEQWERSVREALEDLGRGAKDAPPAGVGPGGASFLEALGEEERRTRTRFLPAVDGIHMLRKNEIKGDLALARSIMSSSGNVANVASVAAGASASGSVSKKSKKKKHHDSSGGEGDADSDDGGMLSSAEDDHSSDLGARVGSASTIEVDPGDTLMVPSSAFVPPPAATYSAAPSATNGEKREDGTPAPVASTGVKGILNNQRNIKSPRVVESVTAFNPPRPPESVGKKKQHRMLRWERRPADVEVDLNNYRKTVDRTRKELHAAEDELERIEATSNHLRRHFLGHIQCMDQEGDEILDEINSVQQKCVSAADLLTSRTRSRGAGKGSYVMRDVLAVLKARGAELSEKGIEIRSTQAGAQSKVYGMGGVGGSGFADLDQRSIVTPQRIASAWVVPGDKVTTPVGEGVVVKIFENAVLNVNEPPLEETLTKTGSNGQSPSKMDVDSPTAGNAANSSPKSSSPKSGDKKSSKGGAAKKNGTPGPSSDELSSFVGTRICVRLPFGVGYFSPAVVASCTTPETLSDVQLAKRWGGILETALMQAGKLDLNGMALPESELKQKRNGAASEATGDGATPMDIDETTNGGATTDPDSEESVPIGSEKKLLPFGSRLLPTGTGRGNKLSEMNAQKLQKTLKPALRDGEGVLGDKANEGVPSIVKDFEEERQESYILQAKVLQLRNELYRQRRIRTLNERTFTATKERSMRVESLVAEMRTDLKSLRSRLDEELVELGIDQDRAEAILKSFYLSQDYEEHDVEDQESSPAQKRSRVQSGEKGDEPGEGQNANGNGLANSEVERHAKRAKIAAH